MIETGYLVLLAVLWFLFYWIFGGAFFAFISVFRLGRLRKARFSCLFTFVAGASAVVAAWSGARWAQSSAQVCLQESLSNLEGFVGFFSCSIIALTLSFLGGAVVVIVLGAIVLRLSSTHLFLPHKEQKTQRTSTDQQKHSGGSVLD